MICLYGNKETNFDNNGIAVLDDVCYKAKVIENLQGIFLFEGFFHNCEKTELIVDDMILKVPTPKGTQLFRITNINPTLIDKVIQAKHIAFDLDNNFVRDIYPKEYTGSQALNHIFTNAYYKHKFTCSSNITKKSSARLVRKNLLSECLVSGKNSFMNRWGGEIEYNNFHITINEKRGSDNPLSLVYGKNIKGFKVNIDYSQIITEIEPRGFNGIGIDETSIKSPLINNYGVGRYKVLKWEEVRTYNPQTPDSPGFPNDTQTKAELKRLTNDLFKNGIDKPIISCDVDIIELSKTEEGKAFKDIETINLGDTLSLFLPSLNIESKQRFIEYEYNPLNESYVRLVLGEKRNTFFEEVTKLQGELFDVCGDLVGNNVDDIFIKGKNESTRQLNEGCQNSFVVARLNEILIGDNPQVSQMKNMIIMNKNGIGFSNKGYQPDSLAMALTIDGHIVANRIDTGTLDCSKLTVSNLSASSINTGTLDCGKLTVKNLSASVITTGTLSADRISGGTINGTNVNITNLNASNITTGSFKANLIKTGTISAQGGAFQIQLDAGKISFGSGGAFISSQSFYMQGCSINSSRMSSSTDYTFGLRNLYIEGYVTIPNLNTNRVATENMLTTIEDKNINSMLTTEHYINDIGSSKIGKEGFTLCHIDLALQDLINLNCEYHVFTQCYTGAITKIKRELDHFKVYGEVGTEFSFELKGKRKQYENERFNNTNDVLSLEEENIYFEELEEEDIQIIELEQLINNGNLEEFLLDDLGGGKDEETWWVRSN